MKEDKGILMPEDYAEPRCLLCGEQYGKAPEVKPVPQKRIIEKMDEYMSRRDYAGAERHLNYWLQEAELGGDIRGQLLICNEFIGHYRKTANRDKAFEYISKALDLTEEAGLGGTVSAGTTYINAATAYNAFGENEKAVSLFEKARDIYESRDDTRSELKGGLYNNMGLVYAALGRYEEAFDAFDRAIASMEGVPGGVLDQAITYLNIADAVAASEGMEKGESRIYDLLDKAYDMLLSGPAEHNGYYAFVCEKCAPVFSHYGYFAAEEKLNALSKEIYERD